MRVEFGEGADLLTKAYPKLSRQLKKCAAYILEHPSEVATLSMRQLAAKAGVPPSTMNRLARAIGFDTYDKFRALYRDSINEQAAGYSLESGQVHVVAHESEFDHALNAFQQAAITNIYTLFDHIDRTALERAVQALTDARTVLVVGMLASESSANYLHHVAATGFRNWHLLARDSAELSHQLESLAPRRCRRLHRRRALRGRSHQSCPARSEGGCTGDRHYRPADIASGRVLQRHPVDFGPQPEHFSVPYRRHHPRRSVGGHGRGAQ